jgi:uncharacterized protein
MFEFLSELNPWWDKKDFRFKLIERKSYSDISVDEKWATIFIGPRRVGKTSIMQSIINKLLDSKVAPEKILFFNAEIREMRNLNVSEVIDNFRQNKKGRLFVFIDEVQDITNWQRDIKYYYDNFDIKFFLTGSSSLLLSNQTSKLTGRFILKHVFPLSFAEYLQFKKINFKNKSKQEIHNLVDSYLQKGGYPEFVLTEKNDYLRNVIDSTLYRDLISIYGMRNPAFLKELLYYLADKVTTPVSVKRIEQDLKVNEETVRFYLKYLQDVYLIYPVYKYGSSNKITKSSNPKYYFNDTGILNEVSLSQRKGLLAENAVYLELLRRTSSKEYPRIFYYQDKATGQEVDFIDETKQLYEVKYKETLSQSEDVEPYEILNKKIQFIATEKVQRGAYNFHNLSPLSLAKFLLG